MSNINLISEVNIQKLKAKKRNFLIVFTAVIILSVLVFLTLVLQGYKWVRNRSLDQTNKNIAGVRSELEGYKDIEVTVKNIETGLKAIDTIESSEHKWSFFLPHLEKATPADVQFTSLSQDGNTFEASAVGKNVASVGRAIFALESYRFKDSQTSEERNLFTNAVVSGYTKDKKKGTVSFKITFDMEEGVLW